MISPTLDPPAQEDRIGYNETMFLIAAAGAVVEQERLDDGAPGIVRDEEKAILRTWRFAERPGDD